MTSELGAVVEGHGFPPTRTQSSQDLGHDSGDGIGSLALRTLGDAETRVPFMEGEHGMFTGSEQHQVGLSMSRGEPITGILRTLGQSPAVLDQGRRAAAFAVTPAPFGLGSRQEVALGVGVLASHLIVVLATDALVGDATATGFHCPVADHLFRRPSPLQVGQGLMAQGVNAFRRVPR